MLVIRENGAVNGGTKPGVLITVGTIPLSTVVTIGVSTGAVIDGANAIRLVQSPSYPYVVANATVYNDGNMRGSSGTALIAESGTGFQSISNGPNGTIGGISGEIYSFYNSGLIEGTANSAIQAPSISSFSFNNGIIRSASTTATMDIGTASIGNEGMIINAGIGAAISGAGPLYLENRASGKVQSSGGTAIITNGSLDLVNAGIITGSVISTAITGNSVIDTQGYISGDVILGSGDDLLLGHAFDIVANKFSSIGGVINGGDGVDTAGLMINFDGILTAAALPLNFERLEINLENQAIVELDPNLNLSHGIAVGGKGTLLVNRDIVSIGPAIGQQTFYVDSDITFVNTGHIASSLDHLNDFAVVVQNLTSGTNNGTILGIGGGGISLGGGGLELTRNVLQNNGRIEADEIAVTINGDLDNKGTIWSKNNNSIVARYGSTIINSGTIVGDVIIGDAWSISVYGGGVFISDGGTLNGNLELTGNNDIFIQRGNGFSGVTGTIDAGVGYDFFGRFYYSDDTAIVGNTLPATFEAELLGAIGTGTTVKLTSTVPVSRWLYLTGNGNFVNQTTIDGQVLANFRYPGIAEFTPLNSFTNEGELLQGFTGIVRSFSNSGIVRGEISVGNPSTPKMELSNTGVINGGINAYLNLSSNPVDAQITIRNSGSLTGLFAGIDGARSARILFENSGNVGSLDTGTGEGAFVHLYADPTETELAIHNSGIIESAVSGTLWSNYIGVSRAIGTQGNGKTVILNEASGQMVTSGHLATTIFAGNTLFLENHGIIEGSSGETATITVFTGFGFDTIEQYIPGAIQTTYSNDQISNFGTITGSIDLGAGDDSIDNRGTINGDIFLRAGDDRFKQGIGGIFHGLVDGGDGTDTLALVRSSTYDHPDRLESISYTDFERLEIGGGVITTESATDFDTITVNTGRLIGLAGSTINAPGGITVAPTGTFGSAGTVNADISVAGTLSPGASPGTMTVNGDVVLVTGSTALFEVTPTVSDALIINGALTIANGVTLTITGSRPLTPGTTLDLITASDGITGDFDTVTSSLGFVRQSGSGVSLLGQFVFPTTGTGSQSTNTAQYINDLIINGTASAGLLAAAPALLLPSGFANPAAIARLSPEAYASALQIGLENGLALSTATRAVALGENIEDKRFFGFGQVLGAWRRLPGNADMGTSGANVRSSGLLGGIGFGSEHFAIGAFIGRIDASQTLSELGAKNDVDGTVFGALATARSGALDLSVAIARDGSSGEATREGIAGQAASGAYSLHGWVVDMSAGYRLQVRQDWSIRPQVSFTRVETRRSRVTETGAGPLDLEVDAHRTKADFIGGKIAFGTSPSKTIRPWVGIGLRHQLNGRRTTATARFLGNAESFTVAGATRSATLATIDGGISADIGHNVTLFANGHSEFGADSSGESAMIGAKLGF